ncbi:unnamed protein product [Callosobruchus maculatus]|nr:unnamed protein product [Callosobruchus maculatus]
MTNKLDKEDANLECAHCKEIFLSKDDWMEHLKIHSFPGHECTVCGKNFKYADTLAKHKRSAGHIGKVSDQTKTLPKNRKTMKSLFTQLKDNGKLILKCTLCDRILTTHSAASYHMLSHTGEKPFSCELCGKKYPSKGKLIIHIRQHTGETPYKCKVCNKGFRSSSCCKKHENVHHFILNDEGSDADTQNKITKIGIGNDVDPDADKVECEICKKKIHKHGYGVHRKSHLTEKKQYICSYCNKEFQKNSRLQRHLRIHTEEKRYTCETCQKAFHQAADLKRHHVKHTGLKQFQCQHCGKQFCTRSGLEKHVVQHLDKPRLPTVKSFLCMVCGKGFTASPSLKVHMRRHTGETPHQCQFCSKAFADKTSLKQHTMRYHTGEKPFTCMICDKKFFDSTNYKKHMKKEHYVVDPKGDGDETRMGAG